MQCKLPNINLLCPLHPNSLENIVHICVEDDCSGPCLLCMECLPQHYGHRTCSLGLFATNIANLGENEPVRTSVKMVLKTTEQAKIDCLKGIAQFRKLVLDELAKVEAAVQEQAQRVIAWVSEMLKKADNGNEDV